jgi:CBS domain-containing protein
MKQQQAPSVARIVRPSRATIQWNDPLDVALAHMNATFHDELFVLTGDCLIGRILRADIERLRHEGNWPGCIAVMDAMDRAFTPCEVDMSVNEARALMAAMGAKQLPAVDRQGRFIGIVEVLDINHAA